MPGKRYDVSPIIGGEPTCHPSSDVPTNIWLLSFDASFWLKIYVLPLSNVKNEGLQN